MKKFLVSESGQAKQTNKAKGQTQRFPSTRVTPTMKHRKKERYNFGHYC